MPSIRPRRHGFHSENASNDLGNSGPLVPQSESWAVAAMGCTVEKNWLHHHDLCMAQSLVIPTVAKSTGESWLNHFITIIPIKLTIIPVYTVPFQAHPYHLIGSWTQDRLVSINYWYKVDAGSGNWWGGGTLV